MPTGSCFCENIKVEWTGEPKMAALCHCKDCRKISGGNYSNNILVEASNFKLTSGKPKPITVKAKSGNSITSNFCPDCGTTLYRYGDAFGGENGMMIIKAGIADDVETINNIVPQSELFATDRISWVSKVSGAQDVQGMPS